MGNGRTEDMMGKRFVCDDGGAVTTDWVALTAGVLLLGIIVAVSVMENSAGYLMDEFDSLNEQVRNDGVTVSELGNNMGN